MIIDCQRIIDFQNTFSLSRALWMELPFHSMLNLNGQSPLCFFSQQNIRLAPKKKNFPPPSVASSFWRRTVGLMSQQGLCVTKRQLLHVIYNAAIVFVHQSPRQLHLFHRLRCFILLRVILLALSHAVCNVSSCGSNSSL